MHTDRNDQTFPPLKGEMVTARKAISGHANIHLYKIILHEKWECGWDWCPLSYLSRATPSQAKSSEDLPTAAAVWLFTSINIQTAAAWHKIKKRTWGSSVKGNIRSIFCCFLHFNFRIQNIPWSFSVLLDHLNHWANHWKKNLSCKYIPVSQDTNLLTYYKEQTKLWRSESQKIFQEKRGKNLLHYSKNTL